MADVDGIYLETEPGVLICKVHRTAIHPKASAVARHLRLDGHCIKGKSLAEAVNTLSNLSPLRALEDVKAYPPVGRTPLRRLMARHCLVALAVTVAKLTGNVGAFPKYLFATSEVV